MTIEQAVRKRIEELVKELQKSLTSLCLDSGITPSTIFDLLLKNFAKGRELRLKNFLTEVILTTTKISIDTNDTKSAKKERYLPSLFY